MNLSTNHNKQKENKMKRCIGFELDKNLGTFEDEPCCAICKWNNSVADDCLLGKDYPIIEV